MGDVEEEGTFKWYIYEVDFEKSSHSRALDYIAPGAVSRDTPRGNVVTANVNSVTEILNEMYYRTCNFAVPGVFTSFVCRF